MNSRKNASLSPEERQVKQKALYKMLGLDYGEEAPAGTTQEENDATEAESDTDATTSPSEHASGNTLKRCASSTGDERATSIEREGLRNKKIRIDKITTTGLDALATAASLADPLPSPATANRSASDSLVTAPAAAVHTHNNNNNNFSLLGSLLKHENISLLLVSILPLPALIDLYAISRPFHYLFNSHQTAYILASVRTWSPHADKIFPWKYYKELCIYDPGNRPRQHLTINLPTARDVASLRWLQMVVWRHCIATDIHVRMTVLGHRVLGGTVTALKKLWFLMDMPLNAPRISLIHSTHYFSDLCLEVLTHFFLKVDMYFTDPVCPVQPLNHPNQMAHPNRWGNRVFLGCDLKAVLLSEKSLVPLWRVLRGWSWDASEEMGLPMTRLDVLRLWVRHYYRPPASLPEEVRKLQPIMGILPRHIGRASLERIPALLYNVGGASKDGALGNGPVQNQQAVGFRRREPLLRPDELVMRECVKRDLKMHKKWVDMMVYGYVNADGTNVPEVEEEDVLKGLHGLSLTPKKAKGFKEVDDGEKDEKGASQAGKVDAGDSSATGGVETSADEDDTAMVDVA